MEKDPPSHDYSDRALHAPDRVDGLGMRYQATARGLTKTTITPIKPIPSSSPSSRLKPPPPASFPSEVRNSDDFAVPFDPDFLRQQQEILSNIQNQKHTPQPPQDIRYEQKPKLFLEDHPYVKRSKKITVTPSPPKERPRYVNRDRNGSHLSQESSAANSENTRTTAPSTLHSSFYSSGFSTDDSSSFAHEDESYAKKMPAASYSRDDVQETDVETDFVACLQDVEMIREQQRIWEQIQRDAAGSDRDESGTARRNRSVRDYVDHSTAHIDQQVARLAAATISDATSTICTSPRTRASAMAPATPSRKRDTADMSEKIRFSKSEPSLQSYRHHVVEDQSFQVGNKNLRVRGTNKTYDDIANGNAIIAQCASCKAIMQVGATAKLLYCSICEFVTPVKLAQEQQVMDPRGVDGHALSNDRQQALDACISRTIQSQEKDVALARKLAKTSR
jgi:hypothetical protein